MNNNEVRWKLIKLAITLGIGLFFAPWLVSIIWNWKVVSWINAPRMEYWTAFWVVLIVGIATRAGGQGDD